MAKSKSALRKIPTFKSEEDERECQSAKALN